MRNLVLVLISFAVVSAAGAETLRLPPAEQPQQSGKTLPLKGATAGANGCAAYGRGFMMVEGTCVKIGGSARIGTAIGR
ncbi:hypothetical protein JQ621_03030 [Bradyrhizobium manausense]|uniref:hypothetical protein n=1 Tax=Bradyrhizobium manausense TaxID=989370 RepID=UPI001BAA1AC1|nr:hypothetical protein [Bradyrhizobium manausense]MBR1086443.1 hypothetical protein [Bradyrhizobium manausense]